MTDHGGQQDCTLSKLVLHKSRFVYLDYRRKTVNLRVKNV